MPGIVKKVTNSFTRPADTTAYANGDLVANSTTAGSVVPVSFNIGRGGVKIVGARISKSNTTITNGTFTLHLFGSSPTVANGDNGAISFNLAEKFGSIDFAIMVAATDAGYTIAQGGQSILTDGLYYYTSGGLIYGLIEAKAAYTPASAEVFSIALVYEKS